MAFPSSSAGNATRALGESLDRVPPCYSPDRLHEEKKGGVATERDEFVRAAWQVTVAAAVDPESLVFVDEMGIHTTSLELRFTATTRLLGASVCVSRCRATLRQEHDDAAFEHDHDGRDGTIFGRRRCYPCPGIRDLHREDARADGCVRDR